MNQKITVELVSGMQLTWLVGALEALDVIEALAWVFGPPEGFDDPRLGEIGQPNRRITVIPAEEPEPIAIPEPSPTQEPEKVPA